MGFSFNRASQGGGGKIHRGPMQNVYGECMFPFYTLYSPYDITQINTALYPNPLGNVIVSASVGNAWTNSITSGAGSTTISANLTLTSSQWIDMVYIGMNGVAYLTQFSFNTDNNSTSSIIMADFGAGPVIYYDIYGYGLSISATVGVANGGGSLFLGPVIPSVQITPSGQINIPQALSGYQVLRDL